MSQDIKIVLVDDEELFRKGLAFILGREPNFSILHEASNGQELISFLRSTEVLPDIVITDLKMPVVNGVEATKIIHREFPDVKIIALTSYDTKSFVANMIDIGAVSYMLKNASPAELVFTLNEVASKGFYYSDYVRKVIKEVVLSGSKLKSPLDKSLLSDRELEVLRLICKQKNAHEIGEYLFISPRTVEGHRTNLLLKTDSRNVAGLVVYALQNELVKLD
ncbi:two component transcriptional regulator, LuxR family [Flavobacterium succinicans]|uniref:Two component transcriptional regulator, LuxR family n=1 Tax=Flavobacterium succinicans TaxID=29536 RepID=A0A1I4SPF3_9FLAO|nr:MULTISPECIES: response regulator transcription factor [Flavobacterium]OOV29380.1 DNA-binding response regulator [Flavobacterium sp. LM5]SFM66173.1 two component transcriptional regulator, LuxR family [Flavobacterium succinicans]